MSLNVYLKIRHGPSSLQKNIILEVLEKDISSAIFGRCAFNSIGCDNGGSQEGACSRQKGEIDIPEFLMTDHNKESETCKIAALSGESILHNAHHAKEDGLEAYKECAESDDTEEDIWDGL